MDFFVIALFFITFEIGYSCIPTQNVCSTCSSIYDSSCTGGGGYSCLTAGETGVSDTLGSPPDAGLASLGSNVCWNALSCPSGSTREYSLAVGMTGGNGYTGQTIAYCREAGAGAGTWYLWLSATETEVTSMRCVG